MFVLYVKKRYERHFFENCFISRVLEARSATYALTSTKTSSLRKKCVLLVNLRAKLLQKKGRLIFCEKKRSETLSKVGHKIDPGFWGSAS